MKCIKPIWIKNDSYEGEVACGKCIGCRVNKKILWSMRCCHELYEHKKSIFVTLTYDSKLHYPQAYSLEKAHLQKFIKRLRKSLGSRIPKGRIRYFAAGEYGEKTQRPHYHLIIFGIGFSEKQLIMDCWNYTDWNVESIREKAFGIAERQSIQYVAKYIEKQLNGPAALEQYKNLGREPVFKISSLGIGKVWAEKNAAQYQDQGFITINGRQVAIPRYYINRTGIDTKKAKEFAKEKECDFIESVTGLYSDKEAVLKSCDVESIILIDEKERQIRQQIEKNLKARINLRTKKL